MLKLNERYDDLQLNGLMIIQNPDYYCFTSDAVLIANFAKVKNGGKLCDLGTGSGIIPLLLAAKTNASLLIGVELQEYMADMATRSIEYNNLSDRIRIVEGNIKGIHKVLNMEFDTVVTNPPYMPCGRGEVSSCESSAIARHEIHIKLIEIIEEAAKLTKYGGKFYIINKAERLAEIIHYMREYGIEPKELINVYRGRDTADTVMVMGIRGGKAGIKIFNKSSN